jgi:hypothetical protein
MTDLTALKPMENSADLDSDVTRKAQQKTNAP